MLIDKLRSSNLYSKMELAVWDTEDIAKKTAKAVTDPENIKKVAKTACAFATISSAAGTGACVGTMLIEGASKKLVTKTAINATKWAAFKAGYDALDGKTKK